jgi:hypothetical protein
MRRYAPALNLETAFISFIPVAQESSLLHPPTDVARPWSQVNGIIRNNYTLSYMDCQEMKRRRV